MAQYYLMAQLPSLEGLSESTPLPIDEERFCELCERFLGKKALEEFRKLTLLPPKEPEKSSSALINEWNKGERDLRLALAKVRAERIKKTFDVAEILSNELLRIARTAVETENPLEAEKLLNNYRLELLETLKPMDNFAEDSVFYYGLKLKLILRIRKFDTALGRAEYKNIYDSILNGDSLEA